MGTKQQKEESERTLTLITTLVLLLALAPLISATTLTYDSDKNTITTNYDQNNRILNQTTTSLTAQYVYDIEKNNTLTNVSNNNLVTQFEYDSKNRIIKETRIIDGITFGKTYSYDSMDRPTKIQDTTNSLTLNYGDNVLLTGIQNLINISYNAQSQPINKIFANNLQTNFAYDDKSRIIEIITNPSQELNYEYDKVGNIVQIIDSNNSKIYAMNYDDINRLIYTNISISGNDQIMEYNYNSIGNLLAVNTGEENLSYAYSLYAHAPTGFNLPGSLITSLIFPLNNSVYEDGIVNFTCSATDTNELTNVTLYGSWNGGWHANETRVITGISNSTTFTKTLPNGIYEWNCLAYDNESNSDWAMYNKTVELNFLGNFTTIQLYHPKGGETFMTNTSIKINWSRVRYFPNEIITYFLEYSNDSGVNWYEIVSNFGLLNELSDGSKNKTLEFNQSETKTVYLKIPKNATVINASIAWEVLE